MLDSKQFFIILSLCITHITFASSFAGSNNNTHEIWAPKHTFDCHTVWNEPEEANDVMECFSDFKRLGKHLIYMMLPLFSIIVCVLMVFGFPAVVFGFKHYRHRLGITKRSIENARCCIWMLILFTTLWAFGGLVIIVTGTVMLKSNSPKVVEHLVNGPLKYTNQTGEKILDFTSDWSNGKRQLQPTLTEGAVFEAQDMLIDAVLRIERYYMSHLNFISGISCFLGAIQFGILLLNIPIALFHFWILRYPIFFSFIYWMLGIIFAVTSFFWNMASYIWGSLNQEFVLHQMRKPGLFQWYLLPNSRKYADFELYGTNVQKQEELLISKACDMLLYACEAQSDPGDIIPKKEKETNRKTKKNEDSEIDLFTNAMNVFFSNSNKFSKNRWIPSISGILPKWFKKDYTEESFFESAVRSLSKSGSQNAQTGTSYSKPITCGGEITDHLACSSFHSLVYIFLSSRVKGSAQYCPIFGRSCSIYECALGCTNNAMKSIAYAIWYQVSMAENMTAAVSYSNPMMDNNFLFDKMTNMFATSNDFRVALHLLGLGFLIGSIMFGFSIYIIIRGSCVWGKYFSAK